MNCVIHVGFRDLMFLPLQKCWSLCCHHKLEPTIACGDGSRREHSNMRREPEPLTRCCSTDGKLATNGNSPPSEASLPTETSLSTTALTIRKPRYRQLPTDTTDGLPTETVDLTTDVNLTTDGNIDTDVTPPPRKKTSLPRETPIATETSPPTKTHQMCFASGLSRNACR